MDQWYVARGKVKKGPFSRAQLQTLARKGVLRPSDMLWRQGTQKWLAAHELPGLLPPKEAVQELPAPGALSAAAAVPTPALDQPTEPLVVPVEVDSAASGGDRRPWVWIGVAGAGFCMIALGAAWLLLQNPEPSEKTDVADASTSAFNIERKESTNGNRPAPNPNKGDAKAKDDTKKPATNPSKGDPKAKEDTNRPTSDPSKGDPKSKEETKKTAPDPGNGDTKPKDDTKKPAPQPEERKPEVLTEDDTTLLGLASAW